MNDDRFALPLWAQILGRVLCGLLAAATMGLIGQHHSDRNVMVAGISLGLLTGVGFGGRALGWVFDAWSKAGH